MRFLLAAVALVLLGSTYLNGVAAAPSGPAEGLTAVRVPGLRLKASTRNVVIDEVGIPHVLGEVVNTSKSKVLLPQVEVTLFGKNNQVLQKIPAYTRCIFYMRPGDSAPIDVPVIETQPVDHFTIAVKGIVSQREAMRGVSFSDLEFSIPLGPLAGFVQVGGIIRNRSRFDYYFPEVCAAGVNAKGRFLVVGQVPTATLLLPKGQINTFQGQLGEYAAPNAKGARFYLKVCTEDDVADFGCGG